MTLSHDKTPLGSPIDIKYRFVVANDAHFAEDYRVMVHVVDADEEMIFAFDHNPPTPTSTARTTFDMNNPATAPTTPTMSMLSPIF